MRPHALLRLVAAISAAAPVAAPAQSSVRDATPAAPLAAPTPQALAALVLERFAGGPPAAFDSVLADPDGRQLVRWAAEYDWARHAAGGGVVREEGARALLWLAARPEVGNSGHETVLAQMVTGLWEAERHADGWRVARRVPVDVGNRVHAQALDVELRPGAGLAVSDTLDVTVADASGFWAFLNHEARIARVTVDGRPAPHRHAAGLLHVALPPGRHRVHLAYSLDGAADGRNGNFSHFAADHGHARSQHYWHPAFGTGSEGGVAAFRLRLRAPADVQVVTSLPQRDSVVAGTRHVSAESAHPTAGLSLFYDAAWRTARRPLGAMTAELYLGDGFEPPRPQIEATLERIHRVLVERFGEPAGRHLALVQVRGASSYGWHFRSNGVIGSGARGGALSRAGASPSHYLGHEVAHNWTNPTGPGALFLVEGWATFAEALVLGDEYGPAVEEAFWERQRVSYLRGGHEGRDNLMGDAFNGGVSYHKGAWVLRMLRDAIGDDAFARGMRAYMATPAGRPAGVAEFAAAMSEAAGHDVMAFLRPWLDGTTIPDLDARVEDGRVIVEQRGPVFRLPLEVELHAASGAVVRRLALSRRADTLDVRDVPGVTDVRLDPRHRVLMHRRHGDVVRFELRAPGAREVALAGTFTGQRLPATLVDGVWRVEVPLSAGRYGYGWWVDGEYRVSDELDGRVVPARVRLTGAYPR